MGAITWTSYGTLTAYLGTELNGLVNGGNKLGAAIDNSTALAILADVEIALASFTPGSNPYVDVSVIASLDGANYEDGSDTVDPPSGAQKYTRAITTGASAKRIVIPRLVIPPGSFKLLFQNNAGASLAATGNTIKYRTYGQAVA